MVIHSLTAMQSDFPGVIPGLIQDSDFGSVCNVMHALFASIKVQPDLISISWGSSHWSATLSDAHAHSSGPTVLHTLVCLNSCRFNNNNNNNLMPAAWQPNTSAPYNCYYDNLEMITCSTRIGHSGGARMPVGHYLSKLSPHLAKWVSPTRIRMLLLQCNCWTHSVATRNIMSISILECILYLSPPQHTEKLLYDEDRCTCDLKWHCVPHDACFIHDSCFYKGSGSFPPVKPPHLSWSDFSYDWYCELASCLKLHPHSPLPHFGSEVEYSPLVMLYYCVLPSADWALSLQILPGLLLGNGYCLYPLSSLLSSSPLLFCGFLLWYRYCLALSESVDYCLVILGYWWYLACTVL